MMVLLMGWFSGMQLLGANPCRGIMPWGMVTMGPWFKMAGMGAAVEAMWRFGSMPFCG